MESADPRIQLVVCALVGAHCVPEIHDGWDTMPQPRSLIDLLRTKTGSDDLLRTLLRAQAAHSQSAVQSLSDQTAIRVVALNKTDGTKR